MKKDLQKILKKWEDRRREVWGKDETSYMIFVDCIRDLGEVAKKTVVTSEEEVKEYLRENYWDPVNGLTCGIDCECQDSCLEFFCECGNSASSNRIWCCDVCGEYVFPS